MLIFASGGILILIINLFFFLSSNCEQYRRWSLSIFLNPCRYSGTGRVTWSLNSGIWSTTCWCRSCCCVYVPTSTSMTSGKGDRDDEEEEKGKRMYLMDKEDSMKDRNSMKSLEWRFSDQNQWRFYGSSGMTARAVSGALTLTLTLTETHSQLVMVLILQPHFPPENNDLIMIMQCLKLQSLNLFSHRYIRCHVLVGGINPEQLTLLVQHFTGVCNPKWCCHHANMCCSKYTQVAA